jgi:hypothetical protein
MIPDIGRSDGALDSAAMSAAGRAAVLRTVDAAGALAVFAVAVYFAVRAAHLQWDLFTYLAAAKAARQGLDPYVLEHLTKAAGRVVSLPFLYPPIALVPFFALSALPLGVAGGLWLGLKLLGLAALAVVWKRLAARDASWLETALVLVFASNASAIADLRAGNLGIVEAVLLWLAFAHFARGRRVAFAALVVLAACFKLLPAAFLLLLLVPAGGDRPRPWLFAAALAVLAALVVVPGLVGPAAAWRGFVANVPQDALGGGPNPSVWAWLDLALRGVAPDADRRAPLVIALGGLYAVALLGASARWLRASWRAEDPVRWIVTAVALFLLLSPRPMSYGFVLGGGVLLALRPTLLRTPLERLAYAFALSAQGLALALRQPWDGPVLSFLPVIVLLVLWGAALVRAPAGLVREEDFARAERGGAQASAARVR